MSMLLFWEGLVIGGRMRVLAAARGLRTSRSDAASARMAFVAGAAPDELVRARGELRLLSRKAAAALVLVEEADVELEEYEACAAVARALQDGL